MTSNASVPADSILKRPKQITYVLAAKGLKKRERFFHELQNRESPLQRLLTALRLQIIGYAVEAQLEERFKNVNNRGSWRPACVWLGVIGQGNLLEVSRQMRMVCERVIEEQVIIQLYSWHAKSWKRVRFRDTNHMLRIGVKGWSSDELDANKAKVDAFGGRKVRGFAAGRVTHGVIQLSWRPRRSLRLSYQGQFVRRD